MKKTWPTLEGRLSQHLTTTYEAVKQMKNNGDILTDLAKNIMKESELLDEVFGETKMWKNKYKISWCDLCNCVTIECPVCHHGSCSGGGCKDCMKDYEEWKKVKHDVESYLTDEEIKIYKKCLRLKSHILDSISKDETEINFKKLKKGGELSEWEEGLFEKELSEIPSVNYDLRLVKEKDGSLHWED